MFWKTTRRIIENLKNLGNLEKKVDDIIKEFVALKNEIKNSLKKESKVELSSKPVETSVESPPESPVELEKTTEDEYITNQGRYKLDYEKIRQIEDPDERIKVLRRENKRMWNHINKEESDVWCDVFFEAYKVSQEKVRARIAMDNFVKEGINRDAQKKAKEDLRFNKIRIKRSAYEKAKYASKRVTEIFGRDLEIQFIPYSVGESNLVEDFYIHPQSVTEAHAHPWSGYGPNLIVQKQGKIPLGWSHSHVFMKGIFEKHSSLDDGYHRSLLNDGESYSEILKLKDSEEANQRLNFTVNYAYSILFNAKMVDNPNMKPYIRSGVRVDQFNLDSKYRDWFGCKLYNENVELEIIEDNKEIDKKTIDNKIRRNVVIGGDSELKSQLSDVIIKEYRNTGFSEEYIQRIHQYFGKNIDDSKDKKSGIITDLVAEETREYTQLTTV